jgi:hypothetical protein
MLADVMLNRRSQRNDLNKKSGIKIGSNTKYVFVLYRILNLEDQMILFKTACQFFIAVNKKK